jgi:hypothetical protein
MTIRATLVFNDDQMTVLNFYFLTFLADNFKGDTEYNGKYLMHIQGNKHVQHYIEIIKKRRRRYLIGQ